MNRMLLAAATVCTSVLTVPAAPPAGRELLTDPSFSRGFEVHAPRPGRHVALGMIRPGTGTPPPAWYLAQWSCAHSLHEAKAERWRQASVRFADPGKFVAFGPPAGEERGVTFALNGIQEYNGILRKPDAPWVHLLAEQPLAAPPALDDLESLRFRIRCRLARSVSGLSPGEARPWHAAQFLAYVTIQNQNPVSPGHGDYYWFGVQLYDSRHRQPAAHAAPDTGGTGKFIYSPAGSEFTGRSLQDGQWVEIDRNLLPLVREGLAVARRQGCLARSADRDLRLGSFNIGWELPGLLDVAMQFDGLSLRAVTKPPTTTRPG
jgi:hypothetical protein